MANITTRSTTSATDPGSTSAKGSALSHTELDSNFLLLNNKKLENTNDDFTGELSIKGSGGSATGAVRLYDNDDSNYVDVKAPATIGSNFTLTLPAADGSTGQFLKTDGSGNLSFATVSGGGSGDITSVVAGAGLTDGATTGDATLNVGAGTGIAVNANDVAIDYTSVTELTSGLASTDELVLNDAGVLKRMDISVLSAYTASLSETLTNKTLTNPTINAFTGTGNGSITGNLSISNTSTADSLLLTTTEDSATAAPVLSLKRNSSNPADNDFIGQVSFKGENDADEEIEYASIKAKIVDMTDGTEDGNLELNAQGSSGQIIFNNNVTVADNKYIHFGSEFDAYIGWDNSAQQLVFESRDYGTSASNKGNVKIQADNRVELTAGRDQDQRGDLHLRAFDEFQFKKGIGFASVATDVQATTNGTTSVTLNRALTTGEQRAIDDGVMYFYDQSSFSNSNRRDMDNYILVTNKGSGSTPTITLNSAISTLSNGTHTGKHLMVETSSVVVNIDGARGNHNAGGDLVLENRRGEEGAQDRRLMFRSIDFHGSDGYFEPGASVGDDNEHKPVEYELKMSADKNTLELNHRYAIHDTETETAVLKIRNKSTDASVIGTEKSPEVVEFKLNPQLRSYAVSALPGTSVAGEMAFCTDETGGATVVFSDGTNWRRVQDRAVAS